jgi:hypothetical protein
MASTTESGLASADMVSPLLNVALAPYRWFQRIIRLRERHGMPFASVLSVVCFVGFARAELEALSSKAGAGTTSAFVNNTSFYVQAAYLYGLLAAKLARRELSSAVSVVLIGIFLGIFPPIVDILLGNFGESYYRYVGGGFSSFNPSLFNPQHYSTGEALVLWASVVLPGAYVAEVTRSLPRTVLALLGSYAVTTFIALGPSSLVGWLLRGASPLTPERFELPVLTFFQLALAQIAYLVSRPELLRRLVPRLLHALPFVALTLLGNALSDWLAPVRFSELERARYALGAAIVVLELCVIALVQNDAFDLEEDVGRSAGEATREDAYFFTGTGVLFVLAMLLASPPLGTPMALFLIASTVYSFDFYRAKRYFPANYKSEGVWAWSSFVLGGSAPYLKYAAPPLSGAYLFASFLAFGGWFSFCVFKDYKDIRADFHAGNQTLYVLAYKRGFSLTRLHRGLRFAFAIAVLIPPVLLTLGGLPYLPSLLTGAVASSLAFYALGRPPRGATVRAFLALMTIYVTALAVLVELGR